VILFVIETELLDFRINSDIALNLSLSSVSALLQTYTETEKGESDISFDMTDSFQSEHTEWVMLWLLQMSLN
jgi:hypothetical protein